MTADCCLASLEVYLIESLRKSFDFPMKFSSRDFDSFGGAIRILVGELEDESDPLYFVSAFESKCEIIPVMLTIGPLGDLGRFFIGLIRSAHDSTIDVLHTVEIRDSPFFLDAGIFGAILLKPSTLNYLAGLEIPLAGPLGSSYRPLMPVFLSERDYSLARLDPLSFLDVLDGRNVDLMRIGAAEA